MERAKAQREGPCGGGVETEVSCLRRRLAEGGGAAGKKSLSFGTVLCVCARGGGVDAYYGLGVCASGEVGSVCHREGQEWRETNMVKAIKPLKSKGSLRVHLSTFLAV